ncbi:MAG: hypothetical protein PHT07_14405 [Paludibacter sp.]|nr:hypothetical protein [Paludibacter sp.]
MKRIVTVKTLLAILFTFGLTSLKSESHTCYVENEKQKTESFYKIENLNVKSFFKLFTENYYETRKLNFITLAGEFPDNWVKSKDIDYLISIINSNKKCCGYMNVYSSYISTDHGEIGGFAIIFLNSYMTKTKINLGLNCNPKTDKKNIKKIENWYRNEFKKK